MEEENYICHIIIPAPDQRRAKTFFKKVFGWTVKKQPGSKSLDVLPPSRKGPSAELNLDETVLIPSIYTSQIETKLKLIEKFRGSILQGKTPIGKNAEHGHYALFKDTSGNKMCLYSDE